MLGRMLRPKYSVRINERVYTSDANDPGRKLIAPDPKFAGGLDAAEPAFAVTLLDDEIHEARVEIFDCEQRQVVTVIEVLSPANKVAGASGCESYARKRSEVMRSPANFVEIDLLRDGRAIHTRETIPPCEYLVHLSRKARRPQGDIWPIRLSQRLPVIPIPLIPGDPDARLDLQAVLDTAYDRAGYDLSVNYAGEPSLPLSREWAAWSDQLLKAKGLRPL